MVNGRDPQRGSALITALFIMTLVAIAATAMSTRIQLDIYRTRLMITSDKLLLASQAISFWGVDILSKPKLSFSYNKKNPSKLAEFPVKLQTIYPDVRLRGELIDLQSRFNINNILDNKFQPFFFKLLEHAVEAKQNNQRQLLLRSLFFWINQFIPEHGMDELSQYYLKQHPPYYPANQPMQSVSELRLVQGVEPTLFQALRPYITALPTVTPININTAPKALLLSLGNGLKEDDLSELLQKRAEKGITTPDDLAKITQKLAIPSNQVTLESEYYLIKSYAHSALLNSTVYTTVKRSKDHKGKITVSILNVALNPIPD